MAQQLETMETEHLNLAINAALEGTSGQAFGKFGQQFGGYGQQFGEAQFEQLVEHIHTRLREGFRERLAEAVHHRLMEATKERVRDVMRHHLAREIRNAFLETQGVQGGVQIEHIITRLGERFSTTMHERVVEAIRERVNEAVRERLHKMIREAFTEGPHAHLFEKNEPDYLAAKIRERIEIDIRDRIVTGARERLREVIRERVHHRLRERMHGAVQTAIHEAKSKGGDLEFIVLVVRDKLADGFEHHMLEGMREHLHESIRGGLEEVGRERLREVIRNVLFDRFMVGHPGFMHGRKGYQPQQVGKGGYMGGMVTVQMRERIVENIRERVGELVRERFEAIIKTRIEESVNERLGGVLYATMSEQTILGGTFNAEHFVESLRYRLSKRLRKDLTHTFREHVNVAVRERLAEAVWLAVNQK